MNGLGGSSNTTSVKPHEFFDHMTRGVLAQVPLCAAACFPAFDDLLTLTMWTPDGDERHETLLASGRYQGQVQCAINLSPSPHREHYPFAVT